MCRPKIRSIQPGNISEKELDLRLARSKAVLLDLDGTLVTSHYDWPAIRSELQISGPSIIDSLNDLEGVERRERWGRMEEIEKEATSTAEVMPSAADLLALLGERDLKTALVTNNSEENASILLARFDLEFDLVLTRDDGSWKPSGDPLRKAMRELGVTANECFLVGDSRFDLMAAREAGCPFLAVGSADNEGLAGSDRIFPDLRNLVGELARLI